MRLFGSTAVLAACAALGMATLSSAHAQTQITGAGSTFAAPIYSKWGEAAAPTTNIKLNYQAIGSGAGINQINNRTVDFGASDMPVKAADLTAHKLMQFPTVIGGVDIIVNIPGVNANQLKLTGPVLADIYLGKITKWNDEAITAINPGLKLPTPQLQRCIALMGPARPSCSLTISACKARSGSPRSVPRPA